MDNQIKFAYPMHCSPRCGAHARTTGESCKSPAMPNGRCRMHGGKTPIKHGLRSKQFMNEQKVIKELLQYLG